jgi:hypothetical protein
MLCKGVLERSTFGSLKDRKGRKILQLYFQIFGMFGAETGNAIFLLQI